MPFLDTNILLRHFLGDDDDRSPRSTAYLRRVEAGDERVRLSDPAIFEVVFTLQRREHLSRSEIRVMLLDLVNSEGVIVSGKARWREMLDLYASTNLSLPDAYHVVTMQATGDTEIISFDTDFDRVPGITRREP